MFWLSGDLVAAGDSAQMETAVGAVEFGGEGFEQLPNEVCRLTRGAREVLERDRFRGGEDGCLDKGAKAVAFGVGENLVVTHGRLAACQADSKVS